MLKPALVLALILPLAACASTPPKPSGFLSRYNGLQEKKAMRAGQSVRSDPVALARVKKVAIAPPIIADGPGGNWMGEKGRTLILREMEAQLCFELSERYDIAAAPGPGAVLVRSAVTRVKPTGQTGSMASAAVGFFIPGPIGVRAGARGALSAEAEMMDGDKQIAAIIWRRKANTVGTDNPSLSEIGDALQFVEPFADAVGRTMEVKGAEKKKIESATDPCAQYGPRIRPEGWVAKFATGLYVPELSKAQTEVKAEEKAEAKAEEEAKEKKTEPEAKQP